MALPTSDVDIVIFGSPESSAKNSILKLGKELKKRGLVSYMETITGARVPIIKMTHADTGTDADICFDQEGGFCGQAGSAYCAGAPGSQMGPL